MAVIISTCHNRGLMKPPLKLGLGYIQHKQWVYLRIHSITSAHLCWWKWSLKIERYIVLRYTTQRG